MAITSKSNIDEYWSTDETNNTPLFSKMSKDKFLLILANLHLVNNEEMQLYLSNVTHCSKSKCVTFTESI
jgi:hypothetical protein